MRSLTILGNRKLVDYLAYSGITLPNGGKLTFRSGAEYQNVPCRGTIPAECRYWIGFLCGDPVPIRLVVSCPFFPFGHHHCVEFSCAGGRLVVASDQTIEEYHAPQRELLRQSKARIAALIASL